jgi:hypothetical protein
VPPSPFHVEGDHGRGISSLLAPPSMDSLEVAALCFVVIVTAVAWWRTWHRGDDPDPDPPAEQGEHERTTLSVDLRDRE